MLQAMIHGPDDLRLDEVAAPEAGPEDVLVRVAACGICGSDIGYVRQGGMPTQGVMPMPLGHEFAGTVEAVGARVAGVARGLRVVVDPMNALNIGNGGPDGGFTPLVRVRGARLGHNLHALPAEMPFERAALAEPLSVATHAVNVANPGPRDRVVIYGAGCIGMAAVVALRARGVEDIAVVDLSEERLRRAQALGARHAVNAARESVADALGRAHGTGDLYGIPVVNSEVFIEAAGVASAFEEIVRIAPPAARVVVVSLHKKPAAIDLSYVLMKELCIRGAIGYPAEFPQAIATLADPALDITPLISHRFGFADFMAAFETARDAQRSAKVMITFP